MIWGTPEADAWSRDFCYDDYLMICNARKVGPLIESAYKLICQGLTAHMFHTFEQDKRNAEERDPVQGNELGSGVEGL